MTQIALYLWFWRRVKDILAAIERKTMRIVFEGRIKCYCLLSQNGKGGCGVVEFLSYMRLSSRHYSRLYEEYRKMIYPGRGIVYGVIGRNGEGRCHGHFSLLSMA